MDTTVATHLAQRLGEKSTVLSHRVAIRLLAAFPELTYVLQAESLAASSVQERLGQVSVKRLNDVVRAILVLVILLSLNKNSNGPSGYCPGEGFSTNISLP
ncbi:MAG: hypothetical protein HC876_11390 [Chloroflexaceae bacterium]|nr:hypothetical protein [Chloroflexaceae bacterium]